MYEVFDHVLVLFSYHSPKTRRILEWRRGIEFPRPVAEITVGGAHVRIPREASRTSPPLRGNAVSQITPSEAQLGSTG